MSDANVKESTPHEVHQRLDNYRVVDVRFDFEVTGPLGAVSGAERIDRAEFESRAAELSGASILVVCRSGRRSEAACRELQALGLDDVTNLAGGMIAWNDADLPVERARPGDHATLLESIVSWFSMLTQSPADAARATLGAGSGVVTAGEITRALDAAHEKLDAASPPDLQHSLGVFREDLVELEGAKNREA